MHLAILLVAVAAASIQYGPGYGGQPSLPSQPSQYPPSYPYPQPAPLPYPLPYGYEVQEVPRCRNCRRVRTFKDDATFAFGTVLIKEKRTVGKCTVSIVTCKGEEGQTFTLIDENKHTLATGSHIRHKIICMGGKRWKTKNADDEKVVFTKLACVVNTVATTVGPSTTGELATTNEPTTTTAAEPSTTSPLPTAFDCRTTCGNPPLSKNCPSSSECTEPVIDTTKSCLRLHCPSEHRMRLDNSRKSDIGPDPWYSPAIPLAVCNGSSFVTKFDLPITCEKVDCTPFSDTCDEGWTKFGHACFKFFDALMTWTEAEANCNSLRNNSHLASIHNAEENAFIFGRVKYEDLTNRANFENAWLGMRQVDSEVFQWRNGQIVNYSNWNSGEPNNQFSSGNSEDCVHLLLSMPVFGSWNDYYCDVKNDKHVCRYNLKDDACFE